MWVNCGYLCGGGANCTQGGQIVRAYIIKAKRGGAFSSGVGVHSLQMWGHPGHI